MFNKRKIDKLEAEVSILSHKLIKLEEQNNYYKRRIWELYNPPAFKIGDFVGDLLIIGVSTRLTESQKQFGLFVKRYYQVYNVRNEYPGYERSEEDLLRDRDCHLNRQKDLSNK